MYLLKFAFFFLIPLLISSFSCKAQNNFLSNKAIGLFPHYGYIMKGNLETGHMANQHTKALELEITHKTNGQKPWHTDYSNPELAFSVHYIFMDPSKTLGNQFGAVSYFKNKIIRGYKSNLHYRIGAGLGYVEKRFDLYTNNQNNIISSRINFILSGSILYSYRLSDHFSINSGIDIIHFSNGSIKKPNQGINIPNLMLGLQYHFSESKPIETRQENSAFSKKWVFMAYLAGGSKNEYPVNSPNKAIWALSAMVGKELNRKSTLIAGIDYLYDGTLGAWADSSLLDNKWNFAKLALVAGHELSIGKAAIITHIGYAFYQPVDIFSPLYQRYGLRYYVLENIAISAAMNAQLGKADFVEFGLTYRIKK
jgi:hypothetical protein